MCMKGIPLTSLENKRFVHLRKDNSDVQIRHCFVLYRLRGDFLNDIVKA